MRLSPWSPELLRELEGVSRRRRPLPDDRHGTQRADRGLRRGRRHRRHGVLHRRRARRVSTVRPSRRRRGTGMRSWPTAGTCRPCAGTSGRTSVSASSACWRRSGSTAPGSASTSTCSVTRATRSRGTTTRPRPLRAGVPVHLRRGRDPRRHQHGRRGRRPGPLGADRRVDRDHGRDAGRGRLPGDEPGRGRRRRAVRRLARAHQPLPRSPLGGGRGGDAVRHDDVRTRGPAAVAGQGADGPAGRRGADHTALCATTRTASPSVATPTPDDPHGYRSATLATVALDVERRQAHVSDDGPCRRTDVIVLTVGADRPARSIGSSRRSVDFDHEPRRLFARVGGPTGGKRDELWGPELEGRPRTASRSPHCTLPIALLTPTHESCVGHDRRATRGAAREPSPTRQGQRVDRAAGRVEGGRRHPSRRRAGHRTGRHGDLPTGPCHAAALPNSDLRRRAARQGPSSRPCWPGRPASPFASDRVIVVFTDQAAPRADAFAAYARRLCAAAASGGAPPPFTPSVALNARHGQRRRRRGDPPLQPPCRATRSAALTATAAKASGPARDSHWPTRTSCISTRATRAAAATALLRQPGVELASLDWSVEPSGAVDRPVAHRPWLPRSDGRGPSRRPRTQGAVRNRLVDLELRDPDQCAELLEQSGAGRGGCLRRDRRRVRPAARHRADHHGGRARRPDRRQPGVALLRLRLRADDDRPGRPALHRPAVDAADPDVHGQQQREAGPARRGLRAGPAAPQHRPRALGDGTAAAGPAAAGEPGQRAHRPARARARRQVPRRGAGQRHAHR